MYSYFVRQIDISNLIWSLACTRQADDTLVAVGHLESVSLKRLVSSPLRIEPIPNAASEHPIAHTKSSYFAESSSSPLITTGSPSSSRSTQRTIRSLRGVYFLKLNSMLGATGLSPAINSLPPTPKIWSSTTSSELQNLARMCNKKDQRTSYETICCIDLNIRLFLKFCVPTPICSFSFANAMPID